MSVHTPAYAQQRLRTLSRAGQKKLQTSLDRFEQAPQCVASDLLYVQAKQKRHSTWEEALSVGKDCGAYRTVLTHFSQRYPKLPPGIPVEAADTAAVAFDGMVVPLIALPDLPKLLPALRKAWEETAEAGESAGELYITASHVVSTFFKGPLKRPHQVLPRAK